MKKLLFLFALAPFLFGSCSSDSDDGGNPSTDTLVKKVVISYVGLGTETYDFDYQGNTLKTVYSDGTIVQQYIYTAGKLTRINNLEDDTYTIIEYTSGQVSQFTKFDPDFDYADRVVVTYSGNNFTRTFYSGNLTTQADLDGTEVVSVQNGNITQVVRTFFGPSETEIYTYDTKNHPFKNISNYDVFKILEIEITGTANNIVAVDAPSSYSYTETYTYNAANFPITQTMFDDTGATVATTKYTYY